MIIWIPTQRPDCCFRMDYTTTVQRKASATLAVHSAKEYKQSKAEPEQAYVPYYARFAQKLAEGSVLTMRYVC